MLVVGWDGAGFELLDPLLAQGRLPHLADLMRRGRTCAVLESTRIPITLGGLDLCDDGRGSGPDRRVRLLRARAGGLRRAAGRQPQQSGASALANPVGARGRSVGVRGPGHLAARAGERRDGERDARAARRRLRAARPPTSRTCSRAASYPTTGCGAAAPSATRAACASSSPSRRPPGRAARARRLELLRDGLQVPRRREPPGLERQPGRPAAQLAIELDRVLGRLLEAAGPDVDVFLVSDHGFRRYPRALDLEAFLLEGGWTVRGEEAPRQRSRSADRWPRRGRGCTRRASPGWTCRGAARSRATARATSGPCA